MGWKHFHLCTFSFPKLWLDLVVTHWLFALYSQLPKLVLTCCQTKLRSPSTTWLPELWCSTSIFGISRKRWSTYSFLPWWASGRSPFPNEGWGLSSFGEFPLFSHLCFWGQWLSTICIFSSTCLRKNRLPKWVAECLNFRMEWTRRNSTLFYSISFGLEFSDSSCV